MPDKPTRVLLIRHGTNNCVRDGVLAARTAGVRLNEDGRGQADALAQRLADAPIAAVYSSPLERTVETAAPLAACLGLEVRILPGVLESDCGEWTGRKLEELRKLDEWQRVQVHPSGFSFPGGESFIGIQARMVAALNQLSREHAHQTIAVVSHSDPIKLVVAYYVGMPLDLFQRLDIAPASITELDFGPLQTRLVRLNDCCHVPPSTEPVRTASEPGATAEPRELGDVKSE